MHVERAGSVGAVAKADELDAVLARLREAERGLVAAERARAAAAADLAAATDALAPNLDAAIGDVTAELARLRVQIVANESMLQRLLNIRGRADGRRASPDERAVTYAAQVDPASSDREPDQVMSARGEIVDAPSPGDVDDTFTGRWRAALRLRHAQVSSGVEL